MAVATQGIQIEVETTPGGGSFTAVGEVQSFDGPTANKPEIEVTHLQSTFKEYLPGLKDNGTITLAANYTVPEDAGQAILRANFDTLNPPSLLMRLTIGADVWQFNAFVQEMPISAQPDSKVDLGITLRVTSDFVKQ